jgi:hypothetical protein
VKLPKIPALARGGLIPAAALEATHDPEEVLLAPSSRRVPVALTVGTIGPTVIGTVIVEPGQHTGQAVADLLEETARLMRS